MEATWLTEGWSGGVHGLQNKEKQEDQQEKDGQEDQKEEDERVEAAARLEEARELVASLERLEASCQDCRQKVKETAKRLISQINDHEQRLLEEIDTHRQMELKKFPSDLQAMRELVKTLEDRGRYDQTITANNESLGGRDAGADGAGSSGQTQLAGPEGNGVFILSYEQDALVAAAAAAVGAAQGLEKTVVDRLSPLCGEYDGDWLDVRGIAFVPVRCNTAFGMVEADLQWGGGCSSGRRSRSVSVLSVQGGGPSGGEVLLSSSVPLTPSHSPVLKASGTSPLQRTRSLRPLRSSSSLRATHKGDHQGATELVRDSSMKVSSSSSSSSSLGLAGLRRHHSMKVPKDMHQVSTRCVFSPFSVRAGAGAMPLLTAGERSPSPGLTLLWELTATGGNHSLLNSPMDVVFLPDGSHLAVADRDNERVQIVDRQRGTVVRSIGQGKIRPQRLAVTPDGHLALTDLRASCIKIYSIDGRSVSSWGRKRFRSAFQSPCGLAITDRGHYVVSDMERHTVGLYQQDGKLLKQLGNSSDFHSPAYIAVAPNDRVLVGDNWNNAVKVFDAAAGQLLFQLDDRDEASCLDYPNGVCVDGASGEIIVAGWGKHRVSRFAADGAFLRHLVTRDDGIRYPAGVATSGGLLAVTEYSDSHSAVRLFTM